MSVQSLAETGEGEDQIIVGTGDTGKLGALIIESLMRRGPFYRAISLPRHGIF
jgi:hypothetical protein